jgi:hypothetical protein
MKLKNISYLIIILSLFSCKKEGPEGKKSLIDFIVEPKGINCPNGGYKIVSGIDQNMNDALDENEIQNTKYICNGGNGVNSLIKTVDEPAGENCPAGGFKVVFGNDTNNNGILDTNEITSSIFVCNGLDGNRDVETRVSIEFTANTTSTEGVKGIGIYGFNKENYAGVDSIIFVGAPYSGDVSNNSIVELYDFTANRVITGSQIKSNKDHSSRKQIFTANLYDAIPSGNRDLGIRIRSEVEGEFSGLTENCYLYLYRK